MRQRLNAGSMKLHVTLLNVSMAVLVLWLTGSGTVHGIYRYNGEPAPAWVDTGRVVLFPITGFILGFAILWLVFRWLPMLGQPAPASAEAESASGEPA